MKLKSKILWVGLILRMSRPRTRLVEDDSPYL